MTHWAGSGLRSSHTAGNYPNKHSFSDIKFRNHNFYIVRGWNFVSLVLSVIKISVFASFACNTYVFSLPRLLLKFENRRLVLTICTFNLELRMRMYRWFGKGNPEAWSVVFWSHGYVRVIGEM